VSWFDRPVLVPFPKESELFPSIIRSLFGSCLSLIPCIVV
jgi:hypothetical protein